MNEIKNKIKKMKSSKKPKISRKKIKTKPSLETIEVEPNSKFKNELFQKLFDNNIANESSKERIHSHGNYQHPKYSHRSPEIRKNINKIAYKQRNDLYLFSDKRNKKIRKNNNSKNSKKENSLFPMINSNSTKIIKSNKISRQNHNLLSSNDSSNNNTISTRRLKNYPNLIKGVLHQVRYYNLNKNLNYNDTIRYKPIDDFFNDQSQPPIYIGNIMENNTNSSNNSINLDYKQEQKYNNPTNMNDNYTNNVRKIEVNDDDNNKEYIVKSPNTVYKKKNIDNNNIKNLKCISPIITKNMYKDTFDIVNEDIDNNNNIDNYDNVNKNINSQNINDNFMDSDNSLYFRKKNNLPIKIEENKSFNELIKEKTNNFFIYITHIIAIIYF